MFEMFEAFSWFRKKVSAPPKDEGVKLVGQEVHVNAPATRAEARNTARMERLRQALSATKDPQRRAALKQELTQRERR